MSIEEIKKMNLEDIEARCKELAEELKKAESKDALDAIESEFKALEARKAELVEDIEVRKKNMANVIEGRGIVIEKTNKENTMDNVEVRNTKAYIDAYAEYIKSGNDFECRKLTSELDTTPNGTGSVPIPEFVYDIVKTAWEREGIMSLVRKSYLKGVLKVGFEISGDAAHIHEEGAAAVSEEALVLGTVTIIPQSIKKWISISDEVYDLRGEEFLRYIYDELTYRIAKKAADTLVAKIEACGTVSTTTCPGVPKVQEASAALGTIAKAMAALSDEAANPVIMMNKATWGTFKALQANGNYGYDPFEGLPVLFNNTIRSYAAATTGVTYAIVGDLGHGAIANMPNGEGIDFKFDELSQKKADLIEVLGRQYIGMAVVAPDAFVKVTK